MSDQALNNALKSNNYSVTKPREEVFLAIKELGPISINELIQKTSSSLDRSSVYRTVALFEELGFVRRVNSGWKYKLELSDRFSHHHHHIVCRKCGKTLELNDDKDLSKVIMSMASASRYQDLEHELEIVGTCQGCK